MASTQSHAKKRHYENLVAWSAQAQRSPEAVIEWNDVHWTGLTAEPGDVDYIEVEAGDTRAMWLVPKGSAQDRVILCMHGGGYVSGSMYTHRKMYAHLAKAVGARAVVFEYAYAHQQIHPAQLDTTVAAYRWLLEQRIDARHIALAADSVGAALSFGLLQRAREAELPLPAAVMIISGWFDMAVTGASFESNRQKDAFFTKEAVNWLAMTILGKDGDRRDPYASPLYANLAGLPPTFLQVGGDETLLDDSRMFAERARNAGVDVRLDVFPEMLHTFQMMAGRAPEADEAIRRFAEWVRPKLDLPATRR
jgi:epsilon-lactone hydrolase